LSDVKRQHYVPRFLLKHFSGPDEMLSVFARGKGHVFRSAPEGVAVQRYYNAAKLESGEVDTQTIEKKLGTIEAAGSVVMELMLSGTSPTPQQRADFSLYLTSQDFRSPRKRQEFADMLLGIEQQGFAARTVTSVENYIREVKQASAAAKDLDSSKFSAGGVLKLEEDGSVTVGFEETVRALAAAEHFAPSVAQMDWHVFRAPKGDEYIISDSPVQLYEDLRNLPKHTGPGYWRPGTYIALPLTRDVCFLASHPGENRELKWRSRFFVREAKRSDVRFYNSLQVNGCFKQVYASSPFSWLATKTASLPELKSRLSFMPFDSDGKPISVDMKR
jgi:hypothetical protein